MTERNRHLAVAVIAGFVNLGLLLWYGEAMLNLSGPGPNVSRLNFVATWSYWIGGLWAMGALPTYLTVRNRLGSPLLLTVLLTGYCFWDLFSTSMESFTPLYYGVWPFFLIIILVVGGVEYYFRHS
ncbi:hypothetical protein B4589_009630 [Halolamina sp. CBA1230]|uniref:hypothetical protein n=1 Tax=Halolamina sp. CBA1230 TaxID=1853690 RepID=UPI0009A14EDA|nr:hypothetical protein [Halolamina sp. CBA1230]QKY20625.1 hypothetical protein B4589_009630 [Halolamina sp. CBA1230]